MQQVFSLPNPRINPPLPLRGGDVPYHLPLLGGVPVGRGWVSSSRTQLAICPVQPTPTPPKRGFCDHLPLLGGVPVGRGGLAPPEPKIRNFAPPHPPPPPHPGGVAAPPPPCGGGRGGGWWGGGGGDLLQNATCNLPSATYPYPSQEGILRPSFPPRRGDR